MNIEKNYVMEKLPMHPDHYSKAEVGKTLIVAGSETMLGSAVFSAGGAMRAGAGMVYISTDSGLHFAVQNWVPEAIYTTWDNVEKFLESYNAVAFGPGLGQSEDTIKKLAFLCDNFKNTLIIEADGLNVISANEELQSKLKQRTKRGNATILTPHFREAQRLKGVDVSDRLKESRRFGHDVSRRGLAKQLHEKLGATIVMKGAGTIVYDGGDYFVNTTGNVGMATAGSGDVLTGIIASFAAQGISAIDAAICGVYVHGLAGDRAAEELGSCGVLARDIMNKTALALKSLGR